MRYEQNTKFPRFVGSSGFYVVLACCLIAIGAASWFAISRYNQANESPSGGGSSRLRENSSYDGSSASYDGGDTSGLPSDGDPSGSDSWGTNPYDSAPSGTEPMLPSSGVANPVSDVPYGTDENDAPQRGFVLPVEGNVSKGYSDTALQYSATYGDMRLHTGIDLVCEPGTDVKAAGAGTVGEVGESPSLGRVIVIDHGGVTVKYCGLESVNVEAGDKVRAGDVIGTSGTVPCECAEQNHIHIEALTDGIPVSPLEALGLQ